MQSDRHERISERAYLIWVAEGRIHGRHDDHWQRAEREIAEEERRVAAALAERAARGARTKKASRPRQATAAKKPGRSAAAKSGTTAAAPARPRRRRNASRSPAC
jgi:topoisomerase IA-like protein